MMLQSDELGKEIWFDLKKLREKIERKKCEKF